MARSGLKSEAARACGTLGQIVGAAPSPLAISAQRSGSRRAVMRAGARASRARDQLSVRSLPGAYAARDAD